MNYYYYYYYYYDAEVETFFAVGKFTFNQNVKNMGTWNKRRKGLMKHYLSGNIIPSKQPVNNAVVVVVVVVFFHLLSNFVERIT